MGLAALLQAFISPAARMAGGRPPYSVSNLLATPGPGTSLLLGGGVGRSMINLRRPSVED
jgi:hypothetical protein